MHATLLQHLASPPFVLMRRPRPRVPRLQPQVLQGGPSRGCKPVLRVAGLVGLRARACRGGGERGGAQPGAVRILRQVADAYLAHARQGGRQARRPLPSRGLGERQADQVRPRNALPCARARGKRPHALVQDRHGLPAHHGASQGDLHRRRHRMQGRGDQHCRRVPRHPLRSAGPSSNMPLRSAQLLTAPCSPLTAHCSPLTIHPQPLYVYLQWDRKSGYRTRSILCVPIIDELRGGKCIGCLQLINKRDRYDRLGTVLFNKRDVELATNLASVVCIAVKCADQEQQVSSEPSVVSSIAVKRTDREQRAKASLTLTSTRTHTHGHTRARAHTHKSCACVWWWCGGQQVCWPDLMVPHTAAYRLAPRSATVHYVQPSCGGND